MFAERLRLLRKQKNISQEKLAAEIGVERSSIGKYEGNQNITPSDDVKCRIADYFNVSLDYLFGRTDMPNEESDHAIDDLNDDSYKKFKFKRCREANGYTQEQLAEKLNMTVRAVAAWESGERKPTIDKLIKLADLYNVTTDYLLGRTPLPRDYAMRAPVRISRLQKEPVLMLNSAAAVSRNAVIPSDNTVTVSVAQLDDMIERKVRSILNKPSGSGTGVYLQKADGSAQWVPISGPMDADLAAFEPRSQMQDMMVSRRTFKKTKSEK